MDKAIKKQDLEKHLNPIRHFVLAKGLFHLLDSGISESIKKNREISIDSLCEIHSLNKKVLNGFITYLTNERVLYKSKENLIGFTKEWEDLNTYKPWYDLLIGGYSTTYDQLGELLNNKKKYATRNSSYVGKGSCGISQFDALPMTLELIEYSKLKFDYIIDIGCGDGSYLIDICKKLTNVKGVGIDPEQNSVNKGNKLARKLKLDNRVTFIIGDENEIPQVTKNMRVCVVTAFVLQEILEQKGKKEIFKLINKIFTTYNKVTWVVIEVDNKFKEQKLFSDLLAKSYYNPYYLLHVLTEQRLEKNKYWLDLFKKANLSVLKTTTPNAEYDSLKLKTGFLLTANSH
jgi:2-ketoarginine methyltransferase